MTIEQFNKYNEDGNMPYFYIGQGWGYKANVEWDLVDSTDIIYIPENAYHEDKKVSRDDAYSKDDFKRIIRWGYDDIIDEKEIDRLAENAFYIVDWQFPESAILEDWFLS